MDDPMNLGHYVNLSLPEMPIQLSIWQSFMCMQTDKLIKYDLL